ncbi:MAG: glycerol-3-phosphate 1-O-acyltransferase PlsY [Candidatus Omnitrophica bacterium]|nr:glycerol-3-phosphate 1-O-acyltransferase PlsY [Candidatus Omnitrophota bacterium]
MVGLLISLILAYLLGSVPTSYIAARLLKRIDIREHGSGNVGATNIFRVIGKVPAIIVLFIDIFKGFAAVVFLPEFFLNNFIGVRLGLELYQILIGMFAIAGHVWNPFLKFKGGKGVATTAGVLLALSPGVAAGSLIAWCAVFSILRIVSVASIAAAVFLPVFAVLFNKSIYLVLFCVILCVIGTYKHKANIRRLLRGEEKKLF